MATAEPKKACFIITPIGKPSDPIRRHIDGVVQGIEDAIGGEFDVIVAHRMFDIGSINRQVLEQIYTCDLVIANLTNLNPNVMYELAFRHSVGRPAIVIAEAGTVLPFDLKDERMFEYVNDYSGIKLLGDRLCACIAEIDFLDKTPRGPIYDFLISLAKGAERETTNLLLQRIKEFGSINDALRQGTQVLKHEIDSLKDLNQLIVYRDFPGVETIKSTWKTALKIPNPKESP